MNLEKIKDFINEKKKYFFIGILLLGGGLYYFNSHKSEVDNSKLLAPMQESQTLDESNKNQSTSIKKDINSSNDRTSASSKVTCDISGAVKHGGVYTLKPGARLVDLIEVAGGLTEKAQIKAINRAQLLKDQDQIYIPHEGEKVEVNSSNISTSNDNNVTAENNNKEQIHLNSATVSDLQKLNGIGEKRAEQIIQFRDANGGFKQIEDITKVSGIGEKTFEKFKDQLAL